MRQRPPAPCDLDPLEYNPASAWWGQPNECYPSGWRAFHHGAAGSDLSILTACGCPLCLEHYERRLSWRQPSPPVPEAEPEAPKRVNAGPVRDHVLELLASGMSTDELAVAAGVDRSTVYRVLRPYAAQVSVATAVAVLAVGV